MWKHCVNDNALYECNGHHYRELMILLKNCGLSSSSQLSDLHKLFISILFISRSLTAAKRTMNYTFGLMIWKTFVFGETIWYPICPIPLPSEMSWVAECLLRSRHQESSQVWIWGGEGLYKVAQDTLTGRNTWIQVVFGRPRFNYLKYHVPP